MPQKNRLEIVPTSTEKSVRMSNALVRAAHGLTLSEKRLLMLGISKLDAHNPPTPDRMIVIIEAAEFAKEYQVSMDTAYIELQQAGKQLFKRYVSFYWNSNINHVHMHWVGRATYIENEGKIELALWHELAPELFQLTDLFTSYKLSRTSALRSIYSWRLFELFIQFKKTGWLKMSVDDFCNAIEAPPTFRANFANLRIKVIEPALREIREKDGLNVTWETIKAGRKVKTLVFTFPKEQQVALPLPVSMKTSKTKQPAQVDSERLKAEERAKAEELAELVHMQKLSKLAGVPIESLLPKKTKEVNHSQ